MWKKIDEYYWIFLEAFVGKLKEKRYIHIQQDISNFIHKEELKKEIGWCVIRE